ncbi:type II secretion system F family protein [Lonepinella sp. MS14437]|uniref:type II secretion system F family protein n=1 Tax=unclassified Lonepinella TaxID=2642006 RepID=UPI0036D98399
MKLKMYRWQGINRLNQKQKGVLIAESEQIARQQLLNRGLQQIKLQQNWQLSTKPNQAEICDTLLQLAILLKSSVPLKNSLLILLQNCTNIQLNLWLHQLLNQLETGLSFSQALQNQGQFLTLQERQLIQVGEMTGKLATVCNQIAEHRQQSVALQRKLQKILLYPMMVLGISVILTALLLIFIVPQFADMYGDNQAQLPFFTQVLLFLSVLLQQYFWLIVVLIVGIIVLIKRQLKSSIWLNQLKIKLISNTPILGNIVQLSRLVGFCRGLHLMLKSGVPLNQALQSFLPQKKTWQNKIELQGDLTLIQEIQSMLHWITQGYAFSVAVGAELFPIQAQQMLQVGEQSGQLSQMLLHIAESYQQQLDHKIDLLSQMLEPLLMVVIGGLIGLIMLGMYLPIFNMGSLIQ